MSINYKNYVRRENMLIKRNQYLDLFKFVFSIGVIGIHCQIFYNSNSSLYNFVTLGLLRIIPPFFFTISGYFFYTLVNNKSDSPKKYLKKYIKLFLTFEIIEVIVYALFGCKIFDYFLRIITVGIGGVYWYIISLLLALFISIPFLKNKKLFLLSIIGLVFYVISATNDTYGYMFLNTPVQRLSILNTNIWSWPQAGLSMSLLFVTIGALINKWNVKINNYMFVVCSLFIFMIEIYFCQSLWAFDGNCYMSLILVVPILVAYLLNKNICFKYDTRILSELSVYIYFLHPIIIYILKSYIFISNNIFFLITSIVTILTSYVIVKVLKRFNIIDK